VSKFLSLLNNLYENHNLDAPHDALPKKTEECETCDKERDIADEFDIAHSYTHPTSNKKCFCLMRKHPNGYNILDMDEDGNLVVDIFGPRGEEDTEGETEENAENFAMKGFLGAPINPTEIALVKTLAGDTAKGGMFSNPQKDMEKAYGTLISKLANKIKTVANTIK